MMTGKKRALLALLLALTMVFSVVFGTVSALAHHSGPDYRINVYYKYGSTLIATGQQIGLDDDDLTWRREWVWDLWPILGHHEYYADVDVTENYAGATANAGKDKADYGIASGAKTTVTFKWGDSTTKDAVFQLSENQLNYTVSVKYMCGTQQVGMTETYTSGTVGAASTKPITVNGTLPSSDYSWASGEDHAEAITISKTNLTPTVTFQLAFIPYTYTVHVEYWYNGAKIADGADVPGTATSDPFTVPVSPSYSDPVYRLLSSASKNGTVTRANSTDTVKFDLELIPSDIYSISIVYKYGEQEVGTGTWPSGTILDDGQSLPILVLGTCPGSYKWTTSEDGQETVTITYAERTKIVTFYVEPLREEDYSVTVKYISTVGGAQVGIIDPYTSGTFVEDMDPFDVPVDGRSTVPAGYQLAAGEDGLDSVHISVEELGNHVVEFLVTPVAAEYSYIINVEYRYDGQLVRTGNTLTATVGGFNPLDITVAPDAGIIPAPYYLLGTDAKVVTVSPSNNVQTVVFELNSDEVPLAIPDDEVPLAEPTTGTAPNMLLIVLGIALTIGAVGLSTISFLKQKKSEK